MFNWERKLVPPLLLKKQISLMSNSIHQILPSSWFLLQTECHRNITNTLIVLSPYQIYRVQLHYLNNINKQEAENPSPNVTRKGLWEQCKLSNQWTGVHNPHTLRERCTPMTLVSAFKRVLHDVKIGKIQGKLYHMYVSVTLITSTAGLLSVRFPVTYNSQCSWICTWVKSSNSSETGSWGLSSITHKM